MKILRIWAVAVVVVLAGRPFDAGAQMETTLYSFNGSPTDGADPRAGLVQGCDGNFYGTTSAGGYTNPGSYGDTGNGTVFRISPSGNETNLYYFTDVFDGYYPYAGLVQGSDGNFYGTTLYGGTYGGTYGSGTVFRISSSGSYTILYSFGGSPTDGAYPDAGLVQGSDGNFYGTTLYGGTSTNCPSQQGCGTVFRISSSGSYTTLYSFGNSPTDGQVPEAGLVQGSDGNFYGTTVDGGTSTNYPYNQYGAGTVFRISPSGNETILYSFGSRGDGYWPEAGLVQGSDGNFYGTTQNGGKNVWGTVFRISPSGSYTNLYSFGSYPTDGLTPFAGLVQASDGNFYGTTYYGGTSADPYYEEYGYGTVFRISPSGSYTNLYSFGGSPTDGSSPLAGLVQGSDGNFYGTTAGGGTNLNCDGGCGTVFKFDVNTTNCTFSINPTNAVFNASGGSYSVSVTAPNGCTWTATNNAGFITITSGSSDSGNGTVNYNVAANTTSNSLTGTLTIAGQMLTVTQSASPETILYSFGGGYPPAVHQPVAGLVQGSDGNFYGTTSSGGGTCVDCTGAGAVFRISPSGGYTTLYSFVQYTTDGESPEAGLVQGSDDNFYGTTYSGGTVGAGTVFRISPSGSYTSLYSFVGLPVDGQNPQAGLVQGSDGNFYGTTEAGGSASVGTVFRISPSGSETLLYSFGSSPNDGYYPKDGLVQGSDGNFYGTTYEGGTNGYGTVFRISPSGNETTLHSFGSSPTDGHLPEAGLVQGSDGNFYGTTDYGGSASVGTVFRINPSGSYEEILHSFTGSPYDGSNPQSGLVQGSDGNFYGTTYYGGVYDAGTVFRISPSGSYTNLYSFAGSPWGPLGGSSTDGAYPQSGLVQGSDGNFYGTTYGGATNGEGTVFKLDVGLGPNCGASINPTNAVFNATGGSDSVSVTAPNGCAWVVTSNAGFITITSGSSGSGNGAVNYTVAANTSTYGLTGTMTIANQTFTITQAGVSCTYSVDPTSASLGLDAGSGSFGVTAGSGCSWTASSDANWLHTCSNGSGNGTVSYTADANTGTSSRTGSITVQGQTFSVIQAAASCTYALAANSASFTAVGGSSSVNVTAGSGCAWTATSNAGWLTITSGASGSGNGTVTYSVAADLGTSSRIGTMTIAGQTLVVIQAGGQDSVGDGIPDAWRQEYFGGSGTTTNSRSCATCDADGTGQNNLFKEVAGLNPTNPASVFTLQIQNVSGQPTRKSLIYGPIASGRDYVVQSATGLVAGDWSSPSTTPPQTNGTQVTVTDQNATNSAQFYRIAIQIPGTQYSVGDGIPDWWRAQYFGGGGTNTNNVSCATCDADGTGQNNLMKYLVGLNPTNPSSVFRITSLARNGSNMFIAWQAGGGRTNVVQTGGSMVGSNNFSDISPALILPGSGDVFTNWIDIGGATNLPTRFYRIRLGP
jgi:uncharacterized repeat protein (TIGR03803 family)